MRRPERLTGKQRRHLRGLAHHEKALVQIGRGGLTDGVMTELDQALETHELVKVRLGQDCPVDAAEAMPAIERATASHVAQHIGRTLVVYRQRAKDPKIELPQTSRR